MNVEDQLRDYRATLDAATEEAADAPLPRGVVPIRVRPVRTLAIAAVAVAATIAIAFAAVGASHKSSVSPAGVTTIPTSASSPITAATTVFVPNVVGMTVDDAESVVGSTGLRTITADNKRSCTAAPGTVVSQLPAAGTRVASTGRVTLTVCNESGGTLTVPVVPCPTESGTSPSPSDPVAPKSLTIANPSFTTPALSGYSDGLGRFPVIAPKGWNCKAIDATDGGVGVGITPPGATPRDSWGVGGTVTQPSTDGVFAQSDGACQGCIYGDVCSIVPTAAADFPDYASTPGFCHAAPAGEQVVVLDSNPPWYQIDDPAGVLGPDAAHSLLRYIPKTATTDATESRVTCILPASEAAVCDALLDQFLALNPNAG
jgi:hypothetical protein